MRRQHSLVIRREDHKRDALGAVFLGVVTDAVEVSRAVARYLGPSISVRAVSLEGTFLRVVAEAPSFAVESQNLVRLGRSLSSRGRPRAAADMFEEALRLDPLNADALKGEAALRLVHGDLEGAEQQWILAGEVAGFDVEMLHGLARIALHEGRRPSAIQYLEEALLVDPEHGESRALLTELKRQAELQFDPPPAHGKK